MKIVRSQDGIAHLGLIILIALVLGGVGFAAWKVYDSNKSKNAGNASQAAPQDQTEQTETENTNENEIPKGLKVYKNEGLGLSFTYPDNWQLVDDDPAPSYFSLVLLKSPDYKETEKSGQGYIAEGGELYIQINQASSDKFIEKDGEYYFAGKDYQGKEAELYLEYFNYKEPATVDGVAALKGTCGHNNPGVCINVLHKNKLFNFGYFQANRNVIKDAGTPVDKYLNEYNTFVQSIEFLD